MITGKTVIYRVLESIMWALYVKLPVLMQLLVPSVGVYVCVFAAHAMRDGHHQGSATSERGRSVKDLKPCSPTEEMDRL